MELCPACTRPFENIWDYPRVEVIAVDTRELPSDLEIKIWNYHIEPSSEVLDLFDRISPDEVSFDGCTCIRHKPEREWEFYVSATENVPPPLKLKLNNDSYERLKKLFKHTRDNIIYLGLDKKGRVDFETQAGKRKIVKHKHLEAHAATVDNYSMIVRVINKYEVCRLEMKPTPYVYERHTDNGKSIIMGLLKPYLEKLRSFQGQEIETSNLRPNFHKGEPTAYYSEIPGTGYCLSFSEDPTKTTDGNRILDIHISHSSSMQQNTFAIGDINCPIATIKYKGKILKH